MRGERAGAWDELCRPVSGVRPGGFSDEVRSELGNFLRGNPLIRHANPREMEDLIKSSRFKEVTANGLIGDSRLQGKFWIRRTGRLLVSDTKPDNFRIDDDGSVVPIDVISQQVADDRMWSALSGE